MLLLDGLASSLLPSGVLPLYPGGLALNGDAESVVVEVPLLHNPGVARAEIHGWDAIELVERKNFLEREPGGAGFSGQGAVDQRLIVRIVHSRRNFGDQRGTGRIKKMNRPVVDRKVLGRPADVRERVLME